jgi:hypothetical protein
MIAIGKPTSVARDGDDAFGHQQFLTMLPRIRRHAELSFRRLDPDAREESVAEAVAYAWWAFCRLAELGRVSLAYPSALARFGVSRVRDGRSIGCRASVRDVLSSRCQRRKRIRVERLDHEEHDCWREVLVEDHRAGPAEIATVRLDFGSWLASLSLRDRRVAEAFGQRRNHTASGAAFRHRTVQDQPVAQKAIQVVADFSWRVQRHCPRRCCSWLGARSRLLEAPHD